MRCRIKCSIKEIVDVLLKIVLWIFSICFVGLGVSGFFKNMYGEAIITIVFGTLFNPLWVEFIADKIGKSSSNYYDVLRTTIPYLGMLIIVVAVAKVYNLCGIGYNQEEFVSWVAVGIYLSYLIILLLFIDEEKGKRYVQFAIFYSICIVISLAGERLDGYIIDFLNHFITSQLDRNTYGILVEAFVNPIKEAMLTIIILDVAIDYKFRY